MLQKRWWAATISALTLTAGSILALPSVATAVDPAGPVVINEVYGGGGNSGATYKNDFIELFNKGTTAVDLSNYSVQYASAAGTTWTNKTNLTGSIGAGSSYLIQEASQAAVGADLPTPNVTGTISMSATAGKVALVSNQTALGVVDFVGFGTTTKDFAGSAPAPGTTNTTSVSRNAAHVNTADNGADFTAGAPTPAGDASGPVDPGPTVPATIEEIQGTGPASPLTGKTVTTKGVVTAAYPTGGYNGYVIQTPGTGGALDLAAHTGSDAVFVFSAATVGSVKIGDYVQVTGVVSEFNQLTEISVAAGGLVQLTDSVAAPAPAITTAFPTNGAQRESLESMLYRPTEQFTVTNTYATNQYGEIGLALGDQPLLQPTEVGRPGSAEAAAQVERNAANAFVLDDGATTNFLSATNMNQTPPYISLSNPLRVGAAVSFGKPVILSVGGSPTAPSWRFQPTSQVTPADTAGYPATWTNTRAAAPNSKSIGDADFTVASFNVLNFFTKLGADTPGCTPYKDREGKPITVNSCPGNGPRGAWDAANLKRQQDKIVAAINGSGADVAGLMEVENSIVLGEAKDATLAHLVDALNTAAGSTVWAFVPSSTELPATAEMDVINNAIIYRPAKVTPVSDPRALGTLSADDQAFGNAREPIATEFQPVGGGERFLFVVNHFKSKGSAGPWPGDKDIGDGQGASNESRVRQATALKDWIPTLVDPAKESVVMVGDYNSYAQEDPLQVLYAAGYTDAEHDFDLGKYSYSFSGLSGSLDHVLLNAEARARATGADIWNINSPESVALQYSRYNYHGTLFYAPDQFAASDHDPVVLGMKSSAPQQKITLLDINDFHGRIDANTVKFAGTVEQLRAAGGEANTAFLSAGDNVGASLFASAFEDDKPTIDVLNALGLQASAVGNHEFDKGYDDLVNRIQAPYDAATNPRGGAGWKYLGANVYRKGTSTPALPEYQIVQAGGLKIGVIGAVTRETPSLVSPAGIADLDFGDPVLAVNRVAGQLSDGDQANGEADVLVASYHEGASAGTPDGATLEQEVAAGGAFASIVTNTSAKVSAIFTGHTHKEYAWEGPVPGQSGKTRPILQTGSYGANIGEITLTVDTAAGGASVIAHTARNVPRTTTADTGLVQAYPRVAEVKRIVDGALARSAVIGNTPVSSVTADITTAYSGAGAGYTGPGDIYVAPTRDDRSKESTLGNLVADSLVSSLAAPERGGATIGVVNPGGLRSDLLKGADGVITYAEANSVLPFVNNLWTLSLTGAQFRTLLEQQWQTNPDGTVPSRPYLQLGLSKNVTYTYDADAAQGSHITSVTINGKALDPAGSYRIGTFSFLATGGDNFRIFTSGSNVKDSGLIDRDAWIQYLTDHAPLTPDFARHAVSLPRVPTAVTAGDQLAFSVGGLNLTSLGSPRNTSVTVRIGAASLGDFPVTTVLDAADALKNGVRNGKADISATVPRSLLAGDYPLTVIAAPSGTTVTVPIRVAAAAPVASTVTLTASAAGHTYGTNSLASLTATVTMADGSAAVGDVVFRNGSAVIGTAPVTSGKATLTIPRLTPAGVLTLTASFVPADATAQLGSMSPAVKFQVYMALSATSASATVVALSAAQAKATGHKYGLLITATVRITNSPIPPAGVVNVNVNGAKVASVVVRDGTATTGVIPVPSGTATVLAGFAPTEPTNVQRSVAPVLRVPIPN